MINLVALVLGAALVSRTGEPEARRWSSFGWHVKEIRKEAR